MADWIGRINSEYLSLNNINTAWKDHIAEYFITSPTDGVEFKLDIVGEETLTAENDVTDHYVESNVAYQDQITRKPKIYTIQGEVGELVWYQRDSLSQKVGQVAQRLEGVISFLPKQSRSFQQMKKKVMKAAQWVDTASNIVSRLSDIRTAENGLEIGGTKQEQAYLRLLEYRENIFRPLTIKTPWGILKDYVITSLRFTQPRETRDKSLISITLKEFRTTSVTTVEFDADKYQGVAGLENEPKVEGGTTSGKDVSPSEPNEDGEELCQVLVESDDEPFIINITYDKETETINMIDQYKEVVREGTKTYWDGIDKMMEVCQDQIAKGDWLIPK